MPGAGDENIGVLLLDPGEHLVSGGVDVLVEVGVTADDGGHDFGLIAELGHQSLAGADHGIDAELGRDIGLFLAADAGVELVDIVDYSDLSHLSSLPYLALRQLKPTSLVAPVMTWSSATMDPSGWRLFSLPPAILVT